jgi:hypothetical protein
VKAQCLEISSVPMGLRSSMTLHPAHFGIELERIPTRLLQASPTRCRDRENLPIGGLQTCDRTSCM